MLRLKSVWLATAVILACSACAAQADLIGYWSLNGNTNDASAYVNNGTGANVTYTNDVPTAIASQVGSSAYFNGTNSKVTVGSSTSLYTNSAVTISFWMKATSTSQTIAFARPFSELGSGYGMEFQQGGTGTTALALRIDTSSSGAGFNQCRNIGTVLDGTWHFVAITADSTGVLTTYLDGVATLQSFTYNSGFGNTSGICFGDGMSGSANRYFTGSLSSVAMWNTVLTSAQITSLYNGTATPLTLGAVPEPATTVMALTGAAGLLAFWWRKRRK